MAYDPILDSVTPGSILIGSSVTGVAELSGTAAGEVLTWDGTSWSPAASGSIGLSNSPYRRLGGAYIDGDAGSIALGTTGFGGVFGIVAILGSSARVISATYGANRLTTGTSTNNDAYVYSSNQGISRFECQPMYSSVLITGSAITTVRYMFGFQSVVSFIDNPSTRHCALFRYSTSASDTTWQCYTSNGSSSTVSDSGVTVNTSTAYKMTIDMRDPSQIDFYIDDVLVATNTTTLPGSSTNLIGISGAVVTLDNVARVLDVGPFIVDTR